MPGVPFLAMRIWIVAAFTSICPTLMSTNSLTRAAWRKEQDQEAIAAGIAGLVGGLEQLLDPGLGRA
jgi:hypothetical protein